MDTAKFHEVVRMRDKANRDLAAMVETVFAKCTPEEIVRIEAGLASLADLLSPKDGEEGGLPTLREWFEAAFAEARARRQV
jgi:hypothetical protein